jgi:phage gp29-like protein
VNQPETNETSKQVATRPADVLAPWPQVERFPIIIGSQINFQYASAAMRSALTGYRAPFVDLLDELLEHDPDTMSVINKRVLTVACGRLELEPADDSDEAQKVCDAVKLRHGQITGVEESLARLQWAAFYGIASEELMYRQGPDGKFFLHATQMIQSRRLGYPNPNKWDLCIWDHGPSEFLDAKRAKALIGNMPLSAFRNKFAVHTPSIRANYPTREGVGRILVTYMLLKRLTLRVTAQDFEKYVKPWVIGYFNTGIQGTPRLATDQDMLVAQAAADALGSGNASHAILPDSVQFELVQTIGKTSPTEFVEYLDKGIMKCCVGSTHATQPGKYGSKSSAQQGKEESLDLYRYDAASLATTWRRDVVRAICELEFDEATASRLLPKVSIKVDDQMKPADYMTIVSMAVANGMPVDADKVAAKTDMPIVPKDAPSGEHRILVPIAPADPKQQHQDLPDSPDKELASEQMDRDDQHREADREARKEEAKNKPPPMAGMNRRQPPKKEKK